MTEQHNIPDVIFVMMVWWNSLVGENEHKKKQKKNLKWLREYHLNPKQVKEIKWNNKTR